MRTPADVFPPGEFLREESEERGWTEGDLAAIVGWPLDTISEVILGTRRISPEMARDLGAALGTTAELWTNLDAAYHLPYIGSEGDEGDRRRAVRS